MPCPTCGSDARAHAGRCSACGAELVQDGTTVATALATPIPPAAPFDPNAETRLATNPGGPLPARDAPSQTHGRQVGPLHVGQNFGTRYHVIRLLGIGGMGAVYQAWDQELEVAVALKVIRPETMADPLIAEDVERRFKRELLLARQVTHKNVVRIHDIGEIDGIKYITMPYVHGADLATVLKRQGRLPVPRAVAIARQVAAGLAAAHEAGVVHRDLKPANIMIAGEDQALIMDFGIARSTTAGGVGMTLTGAIVGTVEYMAPEQAKGEVADHRADIYALGLILRDMLLGGRKAGATTAVAELMGRMQTAPTSVLTLDPQIPEALDQIITSCLQPNPDDRYATTAELVADLERATGPGATAVRVPRNAVRNAARRRLYLVLGAAAVLLLTALGWIVVSRPKGSPETVSTPSSGPVVSLAVLPFRNASGDPTLDSLGQSVSEVLATDLGETSHVRTIASARVYQVLADLRIDRNEPLSPTKLANIADFASAQSILWGQCLKFGDEIRIDATLQDREGQKTTRLTATAVNQTALLDAIADLAAKVQQTLAEGSDVVLSGLKSTAWRPSTRSFQALRLYNEGQELARAGNHQEALKQFEAAAHEDPNFALALSALAETYANLGRDAQAAQYSRRALNLSESLQPQERYLIAASYYRLANEPERAIDTYEKLLQISPNNAQIQFEVARLYEQSGGLEKAAGHFAKAAELDPKHVESLTAVGRLAIKRGDPQASLQPLRNALTLADQLNNDEARATVLQAIGVAYKVLGRPNDALKQYEESLAIKRRIGQKAGMAISLQEIAQIHETLGRPKEAIKSYEEALTLQREIGDKSRMSVTLINFGGLLNESLGRPDDALPLLQEALSIGRQDGNRSNEALALNSIGTAYLAKGQYSDAQTYFERALELREKANVGNEIADTLHNLGETFSKMGRYDRAVDRYLRALELRRTGGDKRAAAIESYSIGAIFDQQGRYGAAVKSKGDALKAYRETQQRDFWLGEILSGYGNSLALAGRMDDAVASLDEAATLGRELQNPSLIAQVMRFQADRLFYAGDTRAALRLAEQASQATARASDRTQDLWAHAQLAQISAAAQPTRSSAARLSQIARQAESAGLTYLSVYASLRSAETYVKAGDHQRAREEVDRTTARAETLGLGELLVRSHYVLASTMGLTGNPQARKEYESTLQMLDAMKREDGHRNLMNRADLKAIYEECARRSKAAG
jgi:eukaryotic-like serine/threonine-protein kinase